MASPDERAQALQLAAFHCSALTIAAVIVI